MKGMEFAALLCGLSSIGAPGVTLPRQSLTKHTNTRVPHGGCTCTRCQKPIRSSRAMLVDGSKWVCLPCWPTTEARAAS